MWELRKSCTSKYFNNNYENNEICRISSENYANHEHLIIQCENDMKIMKFKKTKYWRITKIMKTNIIQCENNENHEILRIAFENHENKWKTNNFIRQTIKFWNSYNFLW